MSEIPESDAIRADRRRLLIGAGAAALLAALAAYARAGAAERVYRWGTARAGSSIDLIGRALADTINERSDPRLSVTTQATTGALENMRLIGQDALDFALTQSSDWRHAINGTAYHAGRPVEALQLFSYDARQYSPMVRADSYIESYEDLRGKTLMPGPGRGRVTSMWHTLMKASGMYKAVKWAYGTWDETYQALASGAADCVPILLRNGRPSSRVRRLAKDGVAVRVLDIPDKVAGWLPDTDPGLLVVSVEPSKGLPIEAPTRMLTVSSIVAVHPSVDENAAYNMIRTVFDGLDRVRETAGRRLPFLMLENATRWLIPRYPVHPGAARLFKERDVWRDDLEVGRIPWPDATRTPSVVPGQHRS